MLQKGHSVHYLQVFNASSWNEDTGNVTENDYYLVSCTGLQQHKYPIWSIDVYLMLRCYLVINGLQ